MSDFNSLLLHKIHSPDKWCKEVISCCGMLCNGVSTIKVLLNKRWRTPKGQQKTDNTEKPAALGTHDEEKQDINTTQHVSNTTIRRQTHITDLRHQLPTNNDRTSETTTDITTRNPKRKDTK